MVLVKSKTSDDKKSKYKHAAASVILYTIFMFILIIAGIMIFKREFMPDCSSKSCMYSGYFEEICIIEVLGCVLPILQILYLLMTVEGY